jgi:hypothetical protein
MDRVFRNVPCIMDRVLRSVAPMLESATGRPDSIVNGIGNHGPYPGNLVEDIFHRSWSLQLIQQVDVHGIRLLFPMNPAMRAQ